MSHDLLGGFEQSMGSRTLERLAGLPEVTLLSCFLREEKSCPYPLQSSTLEEVGRVAQATLSLQLCTPEVRSRAKRICPAWELRTREKQVYDAGQKTGLGGYWLESGGLYKLWTPEQR